MWKLELFCIVGSSITDVNIKEAHFVLPRKKNVQHSLRSRNSTSVL